MIKYEITPEILAHAQSRADEMGDLNPDVLPEGGKLEGCIGEWVSLQVIGGEYSTTYDYDTTSCGGKHIETKTQKGKGTPHLRDLPKKWFCVVANKGRGFQKCDFYSFVMIRRDLTCAWHVGYISRDALMNHPLLEPWGKDELHNGMLVKENCWALPIQELTQADEPVIK